MRNLRVLRGRARLNRVTRAPHVFGAADAYGLKVQASRRHTPGDGQRHYQDAIAVGGGGQFAVDGYGRNGASRALSCQHAAPHARLDVIRFAAGQQIAVGDYLLVDPLRPRISKGPSSMTATRQSESPPSVR